MLANIDCCAAVLAADGEAVQDADHNQCNGGKPSDRLEGRHQSNQRRGTSHDAERYQKCVLPPNDVPNAAEEQGAERTNTEADSNRRKVRDQGKRTVPGEIELEGENRCQAPKYIKIVPFDHCAESRCDKDQWQAAMVRTTNRAAARFDPRSHCLLPPGMIWPNAGRPITRQTSSTSPSQPWRIIDQSK